MPFSKNRRSRAESVLTTTSDNSVISTPSKKTLSVSSFSSFSSFSSSQTTLSESNPHWISTLATNLAQGTKPPQSEEPYVVLPTQYFSLHYHLIFNPAPPYGSTQSSNLTPVSTEAKFNCNCGTWSMFCLPPRLGGCGHRYVQDVLYCGRTINESQPERALSTVCPGIDPSRVVKCAGYMMGLCPTCRRDPAVIQTYNNFMLPFFVQKGLNPLETFDAEARAAAAWKSHRLAFSKWISEQKEKRSLE